MIFSIIKLQNLVKEKEEKQKLANMLENEKVMAQRKVENLRKTPELSKSSSSNIIGSRQLIERNNNIPNIYDKEKRNFLDHEKIYTKKHVVDDINSELDIRNK
jgi:hypothetical protein